MNVCHQPGGAGKAASSAVVQSCTLLVLAVAFAAGGAQAQENMHQITWAHPAPETVSRFVILIASEDGDLAGARQVDVGLPEPEPFGESSVYSATISFEPQDRLAVAAVGLDGQMSIPSQWAGMPPTRPGRPMLVSP